MSKPPTTPLTPAMRPFVRSSNTTESPIRMPPEKADRGVKFAMRGRSAFWVADGGAASFLEGIQRDFQVGNPVGLRLGQPAAADVDL